MEAVLQNLTANTEHFEMMTIEGAKLLYGRYEALKKAGFTEIQAFEIIKARGLS